MPRLERSAAPVMVPDDAASGPRVCVIFATRGRPVLLGEAVAAMRGQTLRPETVIVSCPTLEDAGRVPERDDVVLVLGAVGLAAQRNAALWHVPADTDIVVFFDDDFLPGRDWIAAAVALFADHDDIGAVTGTLLADGINGPGLDLGAARRLLAAAAADPSAGLRDSYIPYGCNMAFRMSAIAGRGFDERLVLYGWLEDRDFGAALEASGYRIVKTATAIGVHLGAKAGRVSGRRLGYSQVVNPLYLYRKGTMPLRAVVDHLFRNLVSNLVRAVVPEPYIDRRGRLRGNLSGLRDALRGVLHPERAADL